MKNKLVASFVIIGYATLALSFLASLGYTIYSAWEGASGVKASDFGPWQFPHYVALFSGIFLAISTIALFKFFRVDTVGVVADVAGVAGDITTGNVSDLDKRAAEASKVSELENKVSQLASERDAALTETIALKSHAKKIAELMSK